MLQQWGKKKKIGFSDEIKYVLISFPIPFQKTYLVGLAQCDLTIITVDSMAIRVVEFSSGLYKLERFVPKN